MPKGSRGGSKASGGNTYTSPDKTVKKISPQIVNSTVGGNIRNGVFDVTAKENGEIEVTEAQRKKDENASSRKYSVYEYRTKGAYIDLGGDSGEYSDNRDATKTVGVNWENVTAISGNTFPFRTFAKKQGFRWDSASKKWIK